MKKDVNAGALYVVATPIGNLSDMTWRAVETLKKVDLVVCEDTRNSKKLLDHYEIKTQMMSFYQSIRKGGAKKPVPKTDLIVSEIENGNNVAFITDAGTPGISDPGNQLVERAVETGVAVIPIPGASTIGAIISVAGIDLARFVFLGFPPHKKGRETFFREVAAFSFPVIYFESPHRLIKNLELFSTLAPEKNVILGRELTKMFEEIVRGKAQEVLEFFQNNESKIKGEMVVIVF
jgi:16S rRNA (cytidine1402-2'-O)-methyltransferase